MTQDWDAYAASWEQNETTTAFTQQVFEQLIAQISVQGKDIFDFGCGTGLLSQRLAPLAKSIVALDSSEAMIEELDKKELANVEPVVDELTRGLVAKHPAFRKQFDLIVASAVCGFLSNLDEVLSIIYTLLNEDAWFVHWDWLVAEDDPNYGLSLNEIQSALNQAGFVDVVVKPVFEIPTAQGIMPVVMGMGKKPASN